MNRFLLQIAAKKDLAPIAIEGSREASAQALVQEQMQNLITVFLNKESLIGTSHSVSLVEVKLFERWTGLVRDLFAAFDMIPEEQLALMSWLDPALMPCIATNTESIRLGIQKLTKKLHASIPPNPPPPPLVETPSTTVAVGGEEATVLPEVHAEASALDNTSSPPLAEEVFDAPTVTSVTTVANQEEQEKDPNLSADC